MMMKSKKGIASALVDRLVSRREGNPCTHCGLRPKCELFSLIELVGGLLCGCVLLCALATGCFLATQLIQSFEHDFFHHLPWHEPFQDWRLY